MEFRSLLSSERDWASIEESFHGAMEEGAPFSDVQYLDLKSASDVRVRVQLLCARFVDCAGEYRILCGFTELHADPAHGNADGADDVIGQCGPAARRQTSPRRMHLTRSQSRSRSSGSSSSSSISRGRIGERRRSAVEGSGSQPSGHVLHCIRPEEYAFEIEVDDFRICWASRAL